MDQRQRPGHIRQRLLQRMPRAQLQTRAASVKNAEPAGQNQFLMYHMVNTNVLLESSKTQRTKSCRLQAALMPGG